MIAVLIAGLIVLGGAVSASVAYLSGGHAGAGSAARGAAGGSQAGAAHAAAGAAANAAAVPAPCASGTCYVAVNVATMWVSPTYRRAVDWPARANPADPAKWVASMTVQQKLWLVGKLETQAPYGTQVTVTGRYGTE